MLSLQGVSRRYRVSKRREKEVLSSVSLTFPDRGLFVIFGPSGSGKTTLLRLIGLLDEPSEGSILLNGMPTSELSPSEKDAIRNETIGSIFQDYNLISHLSVKENVLLPLSIKKGMSAQEKEDLALERLDRFGLSEVADSLPKEISGGEAQRAAFVRATILDQKIILADEPTASVDEENSTLILDTLKEASKTSLVLLVTHNLQAANAYGDAIIHLEKGKVVSTPPALEAGEEVVTSIEKKRFSFGSLLTLPWKRVKRNLGHYALLSLTTILSFLAISLCLGMQWGGGRFVADFEEKMLASLPISIDTYYLDYANVFLFGDGGATRPDDGFVHSRDDGSPSYHVNQLTEDYLNYVLSIAPQGSVSYSHGNTFQILAENGHGTIGVYPSSSGNATDEFYQSISSETSCFLPTSVDETLLLKNYELVTGHYPSNGHEAYLILDNHDAVANNVLDALGGNGNPLSYQEILSRTFTVLSNDEYYVESVSDVVVSGHFLKAEDALKNEGLKAEGALALLEEAYNHYQKQEVEQSKACCSELEKYFDEAETNHTLSYFVPTISQTELASYQSSADVGEKLHISGIYRPRRDGLSGTLVPGVYFTDALRQTMSEKNRRSALCEEVRYHLTYENTHSPICFPEAYSILNNAEKTTKERSDVFTSLYSYFSSRRQLGAESYLQSVIIRASSLNESKVIREKLDAYNQGKPAAEKVYYTDSASSLNAMIDTYYSLVSSVLTAVFVVVGVTNMLIVFLLTQLEVEKRKKEIAVYRAIGSSKAYTCGLFVFEQAWVGLLSTGISLLLAYASLPLLNRFIESSIRSFYVPAFAHLPLWLAAIILLAGILSAVISAFFPSLFAASKPPSDHLKDS